jgi:serine/threonine-protein kinase
MDTDRNLLFGVLALQTDLLTPARFAEVCSAWALRKDTPLADLLVERGWLTAEERGHVEFLLGRKLEKHKGDAHAGLAEVTTDPVKRSLAAVEDPDVRQSLAGLSPPPEPAHVLLSTTDHLPETRERYTLSRLHATGGIGRVWLARDASLGRDVALKELRPERAGNPAVWGRFLKEAQVTGQLEHPGVVPIYEVGRRLEDQSPFYTMRFVRGRTLAEAVRTYHQRRTQGEAGPLELRELLTAFVGVCNAVAYAHSRGVLHRDLKPSNVVLGDYGEVIVLDWGLAKLLGQPEGDLTPLEVEAGGDGTVQGQVLGTPAYMAPEQAEGRQDQLGPATDVYGLGAVLYEILAGRPPFIGEETAAVLRQVIHEPPTRPRSLVAQSPAALEAVCLKALAKKPADRYGSAKELAAEVQRWLADEPVAAYREPWGVRAGRWVKRRRVLVTSAAAAGLVALVGLAVVLLLQARANSELQAANKREQARFELAMEAIQTFHSGVNEDALLRNEQFKGLRDKLLGGAAEFYGKLQKLLEGQADARSRRALGKAYHELGLLTERIGSKEEALKVHRQALAIRSELAARPGADTEAGLDVARSLRMVGRLQSATGDYTGALATYQEARRVAEDLVAVDPSDAARAALAQSHHNIGLVLERINRPQEALAAYREALAMRQKLADANPAVSQFQSDLGYSYNNIGVALQRAGQTRAALKAHEKARALRQKLADAHPAITVFREDLAYSHNNIGVVLYLRNQTQAALKAYQAALAVRQGLADDHPAVTDFQTVLSDCHHNIGLVLSATGQPGEALVAHRAARGIRQKLAAANLAVTDFQSELAKSHSEIGKLLARKGLWDEAAASYGQARAIRQKLADANPTVSLFQRELANSCSHSGILQRRDGQPADAVASFRQAIAMLERIPTRSPVDHYGLACYHALLAGVATEAGSGLTAAEGRNAADRAMAALRQAIAGGLRNVDHIRLDTDLDPLRQREDFQKLMRELEEKKTPNP